MVCLVVCLWASGSGRLCVLGSCRLCVSGRLVVRLFQGAVISVFQGVVISVLYCFCNNEVQLTLRKRWRRWRGKAYLSPAEVYRTRPDTSAR